MVDDVGCIEGDEVGRKKMRDSVNPGLVEEGKDSGMILVHELALQLLIYLWVPVGKPIECNENLSIERPWAREPTGRATPTAIVEAS